MSKTPSTVFSDALASFNRAATLAFTTAQDQARKDATADARDARRERDDAVSALHASRLEEQAWKQEAGVWKATADQAELTINHHLETIAQLREEVAQWKSQCLRLEETSRQEAISWKEQFLRADQERSKLVQRVEELAAEQFGAAGRGQTSATPYTPMVRYSAIGNLSASTRLQRASAIGSLSPRLQEHPPSKSALSLSKTTSSANRNRMGPVVQLPTPSSENQRSARQRMTQETSLPVAQLGSTSSGTRQVLIRRVQAVVEVPVKEESVDRGVGTAMHTSTPASKIASTSNSVSTSTSNISNVLPGTIELSKATTRIKRKASTKRTYVEIDDEESDRDNASHRSEQSDGEEYRPVSDDDDELLMGVEVNRKEVYGIKRIPKPTSSQKTARPAIVAKKRRVPPPTKKVQSVIASKP